MAIKIGEYSISKVYIGVTEVLKAYIGDDQVYPDAQPPAPAFSNKIYGHTRTANATISLKVNGTANSVTSDGSNFFELDCTGVTITSLNQCAYNQSEIADITFDIDTSDCTNFGYLAGSLPYATSIDCSKLDVSKSTNFAGMFYNDRSATIIHPAEGYKHASNMSNIQFMFFNCYQVTSLDLSDMLNCDNVVNMNGMFRGCSALATLDMSGIYFDGANMTAENVFGGCDALTSVKVAGCQQAVISFLQLGLTTTGNTYSQSGDYLIRD